MRALITGASSGIGATYARHLAAAGYDLTLVARREEKLTHLAAELEHQHRISADVLAADLATEDGLARVEERIQAADDLTMLVNNAGFGLDGTFMTIPIEKTLGMIQVHVVASVRLTHAALPGMVARRDGVVINVSSIAAFLTNGGSPTYSATKAYLNIFSQNLQGQLKGTGVKIQALCPGFTLTEFHDTPEVAKGFDRADYPDYLWMSADEVVTESLAMLKTNKVIVIPGLQYKILTRLAGTGIIPTARRILKLVRRR